MTTGSQFSQFRLGLALKALAPPVNTAISRTNLPPYGASTTRIMCRTVFGIQLGDHRIEPLFGFILRQQFALLSLSLPMVWIMKLG